MLPILIPSRGRAEKAGRYLRERFPKNVNVFFFVTPEEEEEYKREIFKEGMKAIPSVEIIPIPYETISEKRFKMALYIQRKGYDRFVFMDDDIIDFLIRENNETTALRKQTPEEMHLMIAWLERSLTAGYAQAAISPREGNNRIGIGNEEGLFYKNARAMRIIAYNVEDFLSVEHNRVPYMEDFDVTLQLLRSGKQNIISYYYAQGQSKTQLFGGCSLHRTVERHNETVEKMKELWGDIISVRIINASSIPRGFNKRKEVRILWKKAAKIGGDK